MKQYWNLARVVSKLSEEDMKNPQNQLLQNAYFELAQEYEALLDPKKQEELDEVMDLNKALEVLGTSLNHYFKLPGEKPFKSEEVGEAFKLLISKIQESILQKKS